MTQSISRFWIRNEKGEGRELCWLYSFIYVFSAGVTKHYETNAVSSLVSSNHELSIDWTFCTRAIDDMKFMHRISVTCLAMLSNARTFLANIQWLMAMMGTSVEYSHHVWTGRWYSYLLHLIMRSIQTNYHICAILVPTKVYLNVSCVLIPV